MNLKIPSGLTDETWRALFGAIRARIEQEDRLHVKRPSFDRWIDNVIEDGIGEEFWSPSLGGECQYPRNRDLIVEVVTHAARVVRGNLVTKKRQLRRVGIDVDLPCYDDTMADNEATIPDSGRRWETSSEESSQSPFRKIPAIARNSTPRTNFFNGPPTTSQFPHLFIAHITKLRTTELQEDYIVEIKEPISLSSFLDNVRAIAKGEDQGRHITRVQTTFGGRDLDIPVPGGEWDWGLVMGILMYSGIPVGQWTHVNCVAD